MPDISQFGHSGGGTETPPYSSKSKRPANEIRASVPPVSKHLAAKCLMTLHQFQVTLPKPLIRLRAWCLCQAGTLDS